MMRVFINSLSSTANVVAVRNNTISYMRCMSGCSFKANDLIIEKTTSPGKKSPNNELLFGRTFADHMFEVEWTAMNGWDTPKVLPLHRLSLHPSSMVLHYANECFEGMKAYRDNAGRIRLFRPNMNVQRLNRSASRLALPSFNGEELIECIKELLKLDQDWIPSEKGYSLYLRPTIIGTQESLGVGPSDKALLFVITSPVGPYYKSGFSPVKLLADPDYVRAWPGGTGDTKIGGNYAPTVLPQINAAHKGCSQILWLFGDDHQVTEVGTMNLFMVWDNDDGEREIITAPLDGSILPGITRDSILQLSRDRGDMKVSERVFTMAEVANASAEGRIVEMFGAGTACIVSPISGIHYMGKDIDIPLKLGNSGELTQYFFDTILAIQYGEQKSDWSVVVN